MMADGSVLRGFSEYRTSAVALLAANALPLFGVFFLGWDTFSIVLLYWVENIIIGMVNIVKMIVVDPDVSSVDWAQLDVEATAKTQSSMELSSLARKISRINQASKFVLIPVFVIHYGFFCLVHGFFVLALFGHEPIGSVLSNPVSVFDHVLAEQNLSWCVAALAASHLCSFFVNFLGMGEYRRTAVLLLMVQPYSRIVILQVAIIFGGIIAMALGSNAGVLVLLILGKTMLDLSLHLRERIKYESPELQPPILPDVITNRSAGSTSMPLDLAPSHPPARPSSDG